VIGDKPTNSLIIMSSGRDYVAIKNVIRDLDKPRRQIFIEALILEVQLNKELDLGTSSHGGLPGATGGATNPLGSIGQNIQREKLNLTLNVTPHISSNDSVRLEIEQETKDLGGSDPELGPTWAERKLKTQVVVHDQESVVIGGLIQEREVYNVTKVPLLGDIPILGYLFKYSTKSKKKTNLLILLTPYIVKDQLDLASIKERKLREYREFAASFAYLNDKKYEAKLDYRRKRGLIEEINRSIQSVEEDKALINAAGQRGAVIDGAVEYAPSGIDAPDDNPPAPAPKPDNTPAPTAKPDVKSPGPKTAPKDATP
jgi:general secretion pathway protein D